MNTPKIDQKKITAAAKEGALKGALEEIKEFYTSWSSPYRKAIKEELETKGIGDFKLDIPDIIALLNESLSKKVSEIANEAIARTYIPIVQQFLTREEKQIKLSDMLKEFISCNYLSDHENLENCELEVERRSEDENEYNYQWLNVAIYCEEHIYEMTLSPTYESEKEVKENKGVGKLKYTFLGLPQKKNKPGMSDYPQTMVLMKDGVELKLPFTKDVLSDPFTSYMYRLILSGSEITIDVEEFDEDMFEERCHC